MKREYYNHNREWPYKNVPHRIIAEAYMEDSKYGELRDYNFFTFGGVPKVLYIAQGRGRNKETVADFFDMEFNHISFTIDHNMAAVPPEKPINFGLMKDLAAKLSEGTPQLRVDFYEVDGKVYFAAIYITMFIQIIWLSDFNLGASLINLRRLGAMSETSKRIPDNLWRLGSNKFSWYNLRNSNLRTIAADGSTLVEVYYNELMEEAVTYVETDLYDTSISDEYFKVVEAKTYDLAPGALGHEIVLNNAVGDEHRFGI